MVISRFLVQTKQAEVAHIHRDGHLEAHVELEDRMMRRAGLHTDLFADRAELLSAASTARLVRMGFLP